MSGLDKAGGRCRRRPQTGAKLDMLDTWCERARSVRGHGLDCRHFLPEERIGEVVSALLDFYVDIDGAGQIPCG